MRPALLLLLCACSPDLSTGTIRGHAIDARGEGLWNATVEARRLGDGWVLARTRCDYEGRFSLSELTLDDEYELAVIARGETLATMACKPSQTQPMLEGVELRTFPATELSGVVREPNGSPAARARVSVELANPLAHAHGDSTETDAAGRFRLLHAPLGEVIVRASQSSAYTSRELLLQGTTSADLELGCVGPLLAGKRPPTLPTAAPGDSTVSGIVTDPHGNPFPGARVRARRDSAELCETISDAEGRYAFAGLPRSALLIEARVHGDEIVDHRELPERRATHHRVDLRSR